MKIDRAKVYNKCGGRCGYCGIELKIKFQIDHIVPQRSFLFMDKIEMDSITNLLAVCASCNNYKSNYTLDHFRNNISRLIKQLNERSNQYKIARRFGLVQETEKKIVFYFEK